jgi:protein gp37
MSKTGIEWTEQAWNPVSGCTPVSPGCLNCYAATMAVRLHGMTAKGRKVTGYGGEPLAAMKGGRAVFTGEVRLLDEKLDEPLRRRVPTTWFVNSMSDLFHERVPFEYIDRVFAVMALCPQHTFQVLTKRAERMAEYLNRREISRAWTPSVRFGDGGSDAAKWKTPCDSVYSIAWEMKGREAAPSLIWPLPNVWLGVSAEDQTRLDERLGHLLACPAAVRFLSCEPLLGPIRLPRDAKERGLGWVIVGGESGARARPCNVRWVRELVGQCRDFGIPVYIKQLGRFVVDRNDAGFDAEDWVGEDGTPVEKSAWPCSTLDVEPMDPMAYQGAPVRVRLRESKGKVMAEWPMDLRVREVPG